MERAHDAPVGAIPFRTGPTSALHCARMKVNVFNGFRKCAAGNIDVQIASLSKFVRDIAQTAFKPSAFLVRQNCFE